MEYKFPFAAIVVLCYLVILGSAVGFGMVLEQVYHVGKVVVGCIAAYWLYKVISGR